jgi:hypothetical protein
MGIGPRRQSLPAQQAEELRQIVTRSIGLAKFFHAFRSVSALRAAEPRET